MSKRKSNAQKRAIAEKQKLNRKRKAERLHAIRFRSFEDMTPITKWEMEDINDVFVALRKYKNNEQRRRILFRQF